MCPKCGSAAAVHSIEEWASMAQANRSYEWQAGAPGPGFPAAPGQSSGFPAGLSQQSGFPAAPSRQSGFPDPSQYQQSGFPDPSQYQQPGSAGASQQPSASPAQPQPTQQPGYQPSQQAGYQPSQQAGYQAGPQPTQQPGYQGGPGPGYPSEPWQSQPPPRRTSGWDSISDASSFEEGIVDAVLGGATKAIGRAIGRRMRQAYNERVAPAMAARQEAVLRERTAIAQRHPDLRACLNDQVIFLAGGTRVLPLASAIRVQTVEQSDALVAQLR